MKRYFHFTGLLLLALLSGNTLGTLQAAEPLRIFLRGGLKTHGPSGNGLHEHEKWAGEWQQMLSQRGAQVVSSLQFPTAAQLEQTDVLVMFAANAGSIPVEQRTYLETYLKRGGGLVCFHDAVCGDDAQWFKTIIGGAWEHGHSKWYENEISFYYVNNEHPITAGVSNFDIDDEVYWDLHMMPQAKVLAASWQPDRRNTIRGLASPHIYDVIPQMWTYENQLDGGKAYRSFVSILGHKYGTFEQPHVRAVLLRGIAWAGGRDSNLLCNEAELASLRYPVGGPTAPDKAADLLELHPEFNMKLVVAEPMVHKPMHVDWDSEGNLWLAESPEYPNGRRGLRPDMIGQEWKDHGGLVAQAGRQNRPGRDSISRLVDSDGDGRMDKREVFYEGLELVTGFVFHLDGVIASAAPDIFWLRDTNHDGKADRVEVLYTGLGTGDTHAVINNMRWGFDGWIYATHGYSAGNVKSGDGSVEYGRVGSGVVRFKPDGTGFEQYASKGGNTWGLDIAWDNEIFFTQPTSGDLLNHVVLPEPLLARGKVGRTSSFHPMIQRRKSHTLLKVENLAYVQIDQVGYFTSAAGCAIYDGGAWPSEWNYNYFTAEPTISIIHHEVISPQGPTFAARKVRDAEFIGGHDLWYCPIETRVGPDGALYILDFYNQAVIHNDTRGPIHNQVNAAVRPDRDHYFGRIYQVNHKQARTLVVPDLARATPAERVKALEHVNRQTRMTAMRLLVEAGGGEAVAGLENLLKNPSQPYSKVAALWTLGRLNALQPELLVASLEDSHPAVRKNALRVARHATPSLQARNASLHQAFLKALQDEDEGVRLDAILALGGRPVDLPTATALVAVYPGLKNAWLESAVVGLMASSPLPFLQAALSAPDADALAGLVEELALQITERQNAAMASRLAVSLSRQPSSSDGLKRVVLEILARDLKPDVIPAWTDDLRHAFSSILQSSDDSLPVAALPLIARWDQSRSLAPELNTLVQTLLRQLASSDGSDSVRLAVSLIGVYHMDERILPAVGRLLQGDKPAALKQAVIRALGESGDLAPVKVLAYAYPSLDPATQEMAEGQLLKRQQSAMVFLETIRSERIAHQDLRPTTVHRLRNHSNLEVAQAANGMFDEWRGPELKEKNNLIAQLSLAVNKPGNVMKGRESFAQNCANCHQFGEIGRPVGPDLSGMGAHGPTELLVHIIDPNRAVEATYVATSLDTKDDEVYDGIVIRENRTSLILRNASGEMEIAKRDIASRRSTGKSLMPDGFEALGEEGLRDLLAYMTAADASYRFLDLSDAFTADSRKGIYTHVEQTWDTLKFTRFGPVTVDGVPFNIINPDRSPGGRNLVVLKGGASPEVYSKTFPQRVQFTVGFKVETLHFLGGVGGWAYPASGGKLNGDLPVMKATVVYADGNEEELVMKDGLEFADFIREVDVPGSKLTKGLVRENQLRYFNKPLRGRGVVERVVLESFNNVVAPTTVAMTAELPASGNDASPVLALARKETKTVETESAAVSKPYSGPIRSLIVGGGSSHDFDKWFNTADTATLRAGDFARVTYTDDVSKIKDALSDLDVLYMSNNQPIEDPATRQAIIEFVERGGGLLLVHASVWYSWGDWPEFNRDLAGGGSRGHDNLGPFDVKVTQPEHPIMDGVSASFNLVDELYWFKPDPKGSPIKSLATAHSPKQDEEFPMVWTVEYKKARIACIALGHDGRAHRHADYIKLLRNALSWAAGR